MKLGVDFDVYDWKKYCSERVKAKVGFKISEARVLKVKKDSVHFKSTYTGCYCKHSILKRGKKWLPVDVNKLERCSHVKPAKLHDVKGLIENMGITVSHNAFAFYQAIIAVHDEGNIQSEDD